MEDKIILKDIAAGLSRSKHISKKEAERFLNIVFETLTDYLKNDKIVKVKGLGTFKLVTVDSRESVNVNTGERIVIKAYTKINFTPDNILRDTVNKPFAQFETVTINEGTSEEEMGRIDDNNNIHNDSNSDKENKAVTGKANLSQQNINEQTKAVGITSYIPEIDALAPIVTEGIDENEANDENITDENIKQNEDSDAEFLKGNTVNDNKQYKSENNNSAEGKQSEAANEEVNQEALKVSRQAKSTESLQYTLSANQEMSKTAINEEGENIQQKTDETMNPHDEYKKEQPVEVSKKSQQTSSEELSLNANKEDKTKKQAAEDATHLNEATVETQNVELLKAEHLTVVNQYITSPTQGTESKRKYLTNPMIFSLIIILLFLMASSFYAGYTFSLLHSHNTLSNQTAAVRHIHSNPAFPVTQSASRAYLSAPASSANNYEGRGALSIETKKYKITGTKAKHYISFGETLQSIAKQYYGDENLSKYIVTYNHIQNPNFIPLNTLIKVPELMLKDDFADNPQ